MIIFDLDGTLADCEHRRHFVERSHPTNENKRLSEISLEKSPPIDPFYQGWRPDWKAFYEACDKDELIIPVAEIYDRLWKQSDYYDCFEIWSGRCESVRKKTEKWLEKHSIYYSSLKMRPIGDSTPDDQLKEMWLHDAKLKGEKIDFVFDDRPKVIRMWRRHGIFVFNCFQHDKEF